MCITAAPANCTWEPFLFRMQAAALFSPPSRVSKFANHFGSSFIIPISESVENRSDGASVHHWHHGAGAPWSRRLWIATQRGYLSLMLLLREPERNCERTTLTLMTRQLCFWVLNGWFGVKIRSPFFLELWRCSALGKSPCLACRGSHVHFPALLVKKDQAGGIMWAWNPVWPLIYPRSNISWLNISKR